MSEGKGIDKEEIQKVFKDPNAVIKFGFIFIVFGFILGYMASYVATANQGAGLAVMQSGQVLVFVGVIFFVYYFLVFFNVKKPSDLVCSQCEKPIRKESKFCPHCGTDVEEDEEEEEPAKKTVKKTSTKKTGSKTVKKKG